jgi:hypothetical protein
MKIIKKIILLFGIWFIIISGCIFVGWESYKLKQDVDLVKSRIEQVSFNSQIMFKNIQSSNKRSTNIQEQIAKIQDFEDRRYNAITAQLNSFWSGVNGFLALIGVFFAMFSWYLVRQVESATKNINKLEKLEQNINDAIAKKSFALYENNIKQDISQIIQSVKDSKNQEAIESAYDILKLRINYVDTNDLIDLYVVFNKSSNSLRNQSPIMYFGYLSHYLLLFLFIFKNDRKDVRVPTILIQDFIYCLTNSRICDLIANYYQLYALCTTDEQLGAILRGQISQVMQMEDLRNELITNGKNDENEVDSILENWFGYTVGKEE